MAKWGQASGTDVGIEQELIRALDDVAKEVKEGTEKAIKETAKETAEKLQDISPKRSGDYARSWVATKQKDGYIVRNKDHYQLTHLLELGHAKVNGGRVEGRAHIKTAETWGEVELMSRVRRMLDDI